MRRKWIPVEKRLPKKSGYVLVAHGGASPMVLHYSAKHKAFNAFDFTGADHAVECTHWMPLPDLPKEGER